jgi:hypothetical protein
MKFGVREICDVVLKAKAAQKIGNKVFYAGEPVIYFDTLKTSSMEGAATTVYAQGGRGNARLVAWEGERTITFTMEDALISPEGFMILSGAGLVDASEGKPVYQHMTETVDMSGIMIEGKENTNDSHGKELWIHVSELPHMPKMSGDNFAYVMLMKNGEIVSEPFIPVHLNKDQEPAEAPVDNGSIALDDNNPVQADAETGYWIMVKATSYNNHFASDVDGEDDSYKLTNDFNAANFDAVMVDYYVAREADAQ